MNARATRKFPRRKLPASKAEAKVFDVIHFTSNLFTDHFN